MIFDKELELLNNEEVEKPLQDKKKAYILLYKKIENNYITYGINAFDILNDFNVRNGIIQDILNNNTDEEMEIYLKTQYSKINRQLKQDFKYFKTEEDKIPNNTNNKRTLNWGYLFKTILCILLFPIYITLVCVASSGKRKRK